MLKNVKYYLFILFCSIIFSCNNDDFAKIKFHSDSLNNLNDTIKEYLLRSASDTLKSWISADCKGTLQYKRESWKFDDWIFLNKEKTRVIFLLLVRDTYNDKGVQDNIIYFLGEILNNKWYFLDGADMVIPRKSISNNIHTALSFEKLSEIGRKEMLNGYYYKPWPWSNSYEINEQVFKNEFEIAWTEKQKWEFITRKKRKKESNS